MSLAERDHLGAELFHGRLKMVGLSGKLRSHLFRARRTEDPG